MKRRVGLAAAVLLGVTMSGCSTGEVSGNVYEEPEYVEDHPPTHHEELPPSQPQGVLQSWLDDWEAPGGSDTGSATSSGTTCVDVTSYDRNWDNDMLCTRTDGSRFYTSYAGADAARR